MSSDSGSGIGTGPCPASSRSIKTTLGSVWETLIGGLVTVVLAESCRFEHPQHATIAATSNASKTEQGAGVALVFMQR